MVRVRRVREVSSERAGMVALSRDAHLSRFATKMGHPTWWRGDGLGEGNAFDGSEEAVAAAG